MKTKITALLFLIAFSLVGFAQIPNSGFEIWTTTGNYENPNGWATMNSVCTGPFYSVTKSTDHYPLAVGSYSVRIENNTSLLQATGGWGVIASKAFDFPFKPAFPITGHPSSLYGYAKYTSLNSDSAYLNILLFKNGSEVTRKGGSITNATWQVFNFVFDTYTDADSATIIVMAWKPMGQNDGPNGNSILFLDNLSFDAPVSSVNPAEVNNNKFRLFPNPASDIVFLECNAEMGNEIQARIFDYSGKLVKTVLMPTSRMQLDVEDLSNGIFFIDFTSGNSSEKGKLIIHH